MEDTLITVDTAKLAKEVGFREIVLSYYNCNKDGVYSPNAFNQQDYVEQEADDWNGDSYISTLSAPTQSLLQKWLREVHKIQLFVIPVGNVSFDLKYYCYSILSHDTDEGVHSKNRFITYEEALEEGLKYALSKLVIPRRKKGEIL
jgi:hypothetical protein